MFWKLGFALTEALRTEDTGVFRQRYFGVEQRGASHSLKKLSSPAIPLGYSSACHDFVGICGKLTESGWTLSSAIAEPA
jgi:hypothetical protein